MKRSLLLGLGIIIPATLFTIPENGEKNICLRNAIEKFRAMRVAQIQALTLEQLSSTEIEAFRMLATEIFKREIASAECFSQANRRKYEVMHQKIAQLDASRETF
jgi:hypothetical protein